MKCVSCGIGFFSPDGGERSVLNVDQKNHMTPKAVMTHVAAVIATKSIF